jgi:hypothetical protein
MVKEGKLSKVNHPSSARVANQISVPQLSRIERTLKPAQPNRMDGQL